ncbi:DNA-processing protein DprA [Sphingosinicella soli]|uniref:DNA processing protein n=1 Tax=Sphingosinicella soli TaxID=333708 RepID=A0A7W7B3X5_9SPHN|nr:DNA-processing protein DprA [Sphingosinicella soli]MBB4632492.1 DNA processing protein [Sphingosinicella soli]
MADRPGSDIEHIAKLRLIRSENVGPVSYRHLTARYGSASAALDALPELARRGGGRAFRIADIGAVHREIEATEAAGARFVFLGDSNYPARLAETEDAPPVLAIRGDIALAHRRTVGIVGARNASAAAIRFARGLASDLAAANIVVVSGLARGIDAAAHSGAITGGTIGVIAGGIDNIYPPENAELYAALYERGLVVAEQPIGTEPQARHFPRRNRLISGLSAGIVVVEAAPRSGSLITARFAGEQGREVMAVPGFPLDPRAQGCNQLIRDGATLVQSAADIAETITPFGGVRLGAGGSRFTAPPPTDADDNARSAVTALLSLTPVAIDELVRLSGEPPAVVQTVLLELELAGRLVRHAGGRASLA